MCCHSRRQLPPLNHHRFIYWCLDEESTLAANPLFAHTYHALLDFVEWSHSAWVALLQGEIIKGRCGSNVKEGPARERLSEVKSLEMLMGQTLGPEHVPFHSKDLLP